MLKVQLDKTNRVIDLNQQRLLESYQHCFLESNGRMILQSLVSRFISNKKGQTRENESARLLVLDLIHNSNMELKVVPKKEIDDA